MRKEVVKLVLPEHMFVMAIMFFQMKIYNYLPLIITMIMVLIRLKVLSLQQFMDKQY